MNKLFFLFSTVLVAIFCFALSPPAQAVSKVSDVPYPDMIDYYLHSGYYRRWNECLLPGDKYTLFNGNEWDSNGIVNYILYYYAKPRGDIDGTIAAIDLDTCFVCHTSGGFNVSLSDDTYSIHYVCKHCSTDCVLRCELMSDGKAAFVYDGDYGSPFLGKVSLVSNFIGSLSRDFLNFVISNWFTLIIISIPLISLGIAFVIKLLKGA